MSRTHLPLLHFPKDKDLPVNQTNRRQTASRNNFFGIAALKLKFIDDKLGREVKTVPKFGVHTFEKVMFPRFGLFLRVYVAIPVIPLFAVPRSTAFCN